MSILNWIHNCYQNAVSLVKGSNPSQDSYEGLDPILGLAEDLLTRADINVDSFFGRTIYTDEYGTIDICAYNKRHYIIADTSPNNEVTYCGSYATRAGAKNALKWILIARENAAIRKSDEYRQLQDLKNACFKSC